MNFIMLRDNMQYTKCFREGNRGHCLIPSDNKTRQEQGLTNIQATSSQVLSHTRIAGAYCCVILYMC